MTAFVIVCVFDKLHCFHIDFHVGEVFSLYVLQWTEVWSFHWPYCVLLINCNLIKRATWAFANYQHVVTLLRIRKFENIFNEQHDKMCFRFEELFSWDFNMLHKKNIHIYQNSNSHRSLLTFPLSKFLILSNSLRPKYRILFCEKNSKTFLESFHKNVTFALWTFQR